MNANRKTRIPSGTTWGPLFVTHEAIGIVIRQRKDAESQIKADVIVVSPGHVDALIEALKQYRNAGQVSE